MFGYIYITTNLINNKKYIGKHQSKIFDKNYLGSGKYLRNAINKYGKNNFKCDLLDYAKTLDELNSKEKFWIIFFNAVDSCNFYNISYGGDGGNLIHHLSDKDRIIRNNKISNKLKGKLNPMYGKSWKEFTDEKTIKNHRKNVGKAVKLRYLNEKNRIKTSISSKKYWSNPNNIEKCRLRNLGKNNPMYGKTQTEKMKNSRRTPITVFLNNGDILKFKSLGDGFKYMKDNYGISENTFYSWFKKPYKTHYNKYSHLNGSYAKYT